MVRRARAVVASCVRFMLARRVPLDDSEMSEMGWPRCRVPSRSLEATTCVTDRIKISATIADITLHHAPPDVAF